MPAACGLYAVVHPCDPALFRDSLSAAILWQPEFPQ
jgi:hypothetical protein